MAFLNWKVQIQIMTNDYTIERETGLGKRRASLHSSLFILPFQSFFQAIVSSLTNALCSFLCISHGAFKNRMWHLWKRAALIRSALLKQ